MSNLDPRKRKILLAVLATYFIFDSPAINDTLSKKSRPDLGPQPPLHLNGSAAMAAAATTTTLTQLAKPHPSQGGQRISPRYLATLSEGDCVWRFRFVADEPIQLASVLDLPDPLITERGYRSSAVESLGLLCARLRSGEDLWSLSTKYARPQSAISEIVNETAAYINECWSHLLLWDHSALLSPIRLQEYAHAVSAFGAPTSSVFGFIDCTIRATCRPGIFQELAYTGYKKCHGMKFQSVVIPNGLIAHLTGPFRAPQNDLGVFSESGLKELLERHTLQPGSRDGDPAGCRHFQVYGDSVYGVSPTMVSPYSGSAALTPNQCAWNYAMGQVRISVEHGFGLVVRD